MRTNEMKKESLWVKTSRGWRDIITTDDVDHITELYDDFKRYNDAMILPYPMVPENRWSEVEK